MPTRRRPLTINGVCAGCGRASGGTGSAVLTAWCSHCWERWGTVPGWWEPEPGGVPGWAAARYAGPVRRAVLVAKRGAVLGAIELLLSRLPPDCLPHGAVVTWIPAHPRRALLLPDGGAALAAALARREGLPHARLLRRSVRARRQAGRGRDERRADAARLGLRLRGKPPAAVVLVDDVRTTGATLDEAASLLRAAGARQVIGITVAIAPPE